MLRSSALLALRGMVRRPYFAAVSLIGIGFTLATLLVGTALIEHQFARSSPMSAADRMLVLLNQRLSSENMTHSGNLGWTILGPAISDLQNAEAVGVFRNARRIEVWAGDVRRVSWQKSADAGFWQVLDFEFVAGGAWGETDDQQGRRIAVISQGLGQALFGGASAIGQSLDVDGRSFEVVGVVRDVSMSRDIPFGELWVPLSSGRTDAWRDEARDALGAVVLARTPGDREALRAEIAARVAAIPPPAPFTAVEVWADTPLEATSRNIFGPDEPHLERLIALAVLAVLGFMALPALNLVTLAMSRSLERATEIGVRRAYGASRLALTVQLLGETFVVTAVGAVAALGLAALGLEILEASQALPGARLAISPRTVVVAGILAAVFALLSGGLPAWRMARFHPVEALAGRSIR